MLKRKQKKTPNKKLIGASVGVVAALLGATVLKKPRNR